MPIDLRELNKHWIFESDKSGVWDVYGYSIKAMKAIEEFNTGENQDSAEGVRALMGVICKRHVDSEDGEDRQSSGEDKIKNFSDEDIQRFAREFIEKNANLFEGLDDSLTKKQDQSDSDFLMEVLSAINQKQSEQLRKIFEDMNARLRGILGTSNTELDSVTQDLLKQNKRLKETYAPKVSMFDPLVPQIEPIQPPENPAHETNDKLSEMNSRLDRLIEFGENALQIMNGLQNAAAVFLAKFTQEAQKNSQAANKAILVSIFAVLFSFFQIIYTEFIRVPRENASMEAALNSVRGDIELLRTTLSENLTDSQVAQTTISETFADALDATGEQNAALLENIAQLLRQQRERDQAILSALEAIVTAGPRSSD